MWNQAFFIIIFFLLIGGGVLNLIVNNNGNKKYLVYDIFLFITLVSIVLVNRCLFKLVTGFVILNAISITNIVYVIGVCSLSLLAMTTKTIYRTNKLPSLLSVAIHITIYISILIVLMFISCLLYHQSDCYILEVLPAQTELKSTLSTLSGIISGAIMWDFNTDLWLDRFKLKMNNTINDNMGYSTRNKPNVCMSLSGNNNGKCLNQPSNRGISVTNILNLPPGSTPTVPSSSSHVDNYSSSHVDSSYSNNNNSTNSLSGVNSSNSGVGNRGIPIADILNPLPAFTPAVSSSSSHVHSSSSNNNNSSTSSNPVNSFSSDVNSNSSIYSNLAPHYSSAANNSFASSAIQPGYTTQFASDNSIPRCIRNSVGPGSPAYNWIIRQELNSNLLSEIRREEDKLRTRVQRNVVTIENSINSNEELDNRKLSIFVSRLRRNTDMLQTNMSKRFCFWQETGRLNTIHGNHVKCSRTSIDTLARVRACLNNLPSNLNTQSGSSIQANSSIQASSSSEVAYSSQTNSTS